MAAKQLQDLAPSVLVDVALDERARVEVCPRHSLGPILAILDDSLRQRLTLDRRRPPARRRCSALPGRWLEEALVDHCLYRDVEAVFVFDGLDHGDRMPALG